MVVRGVDKVGMAFSQVSQQGAECGVISGQRRQVEGAAAVLVRQAGVGPRPQQHLHHLDLPGDHRQVERSLKQAEQGEGLVFR